jgi:hypothetical protein
VVLQFLPLRVVRLRLIVDKGERTNLSDHPGPDWYINWL